MRFLMAGLSDIGRHRDLNEDSFLVAELPLATPAAKGPAYLLAVADGIGGHSAGEVASAAAVETLRTVVAGRLALPGPVPDLAAVLREAFASVNDEVYRRATATTHLNGMGTTLVAVLAAAGRATAANVGDSRLYLGRGEAMTQISVDHSWAAEQVRSKLMAEADIERSPFRNVVTRSIGGAEPPSVDTFELDLRPGDSLLLASDGLFGPLEEKALRKLFRRRRKPESICRALVKAANKAGGRDNLTAVVAAVQPD